MIFRWKRAFPSFLDSIQSAGILLGKFYLFSPLLVFWLGSKVLGDTKVLLQSAFFYYVLNQNSFTASKAGIQNFRSVGGKEHKQHLNNLGTGLTIVHWEDNFFQHFLPSYNLWRTHRLLCRLILGPPCLKEAVRDHHIWSHLQSKVNSGFKFLNIFFFLSATHLVNNSHWSERWRDTKNAPWKAVRPHAEFGE